MPLSCERGELRGLESDLFTGGLPTTDDRVFITLRRADGSFSDVSCQRAGDRAPPSERVEVFGNGRTGCLEGWDRIDFWVGGRHHKASGGKDKGHRAESGAFLSACRSGGGARPIPLVELHLRY